MRRLVLAVLGAITVAAVAGQPPAPTPTLSRPRVDPRRPPERELETSIGDGFTLAAVGDLGTRIEIEGPVGVIRIP